MNINKLRLLTVSVILFITACLSAEGAGGDSCNQPEISENESAYLSDSVFCHEIDSVSPVITDIVRFCVRQFEPDSVSFCNVYVVRDTVGDVFYGVKGLIVNVTMYPNWQTRSLKYKNWDYFRCDKLPVFIYNESGNTLFRLKSPLTEIKVDYLKPINTQYEEGSVDWADGWSFLLENDKVYLLYNFSRCLGKCKYEIDLNKTMLKPEYYKNLLEQYFKMRDDIYQ